MVAGLPLWVIWHVRAANNLLLLGERLDYTPGWHAGWWLVPFANLVVPYRTMRELIVLSQPHGRPGGRAGLAEAVVGGRIDGSVLAGLSGPFQEIDPQMSLAMNLLSVLLLFGVSAMYVLYIRRVSLDQELRFAKIAA